MNEEYTGSPSASEVSKRIVAEMLSEQPTDDSIKKALDKLDDLSKSENKRE